MQGRYGPAGRRGQGISVEAAPDAGSGYGGAARAADEADPAVESVQPVSG
jgi:hypothetical protein